MQLLKIICLLVALMYGLERSKYNRATFYTQDAIGYIDYSFQNASKRQCFRKQCITPVYDTKSFLYSTKNLSLLHNSTFTPMTIAFYFLFERINDG